MIVCSVALIIQEDMILLGKRNPKRDMRPNLWDLFGGHLEEGEQPKEALLRELREELNVTPIQFTYFATVKESSKSTFEDYTHLVYLVTRWNGSPKNMQPHEHTEIRWFSFEQALSLDLALPDYPDLFRTAEAKWREFASIPNYVL